MRLQIEDILVQEFGGTRLEFTARVSESPWALMHFMVRLPSDDPGATPVDVSEDNRIRIQGLLSEAARTWTDRLIAAAADGSVGHADAEYYADAFPEVYKQAVTPADAIDHIAIIKALQDNSVKLVFLEGEDGSAQLTWFMGGRTASLSQLLPMLQSMGVVVLEERPFTVTRSDGLPVWIYQFKISPHPTIESASTQAERDEMAERFADAVTAIWHGRLEIDRFNELVMRAGLRWQQVVLLRAYAKYLRQANFPTVSPISNRCSTSTPRPRGRWSRCSRRCSTPTRRVPRQAATRRRPPPRSRPTLTPWWGWIPTASCAPSRRWCRPRCGPITL